MVNIKIGLAAYNMTLTPPRIAIERGYFKADHLNVSVERLNGSVVTAAALESGGIQFALTGASPFVKGQAKGTHLLAIAAIDKGFTSSVLVSSGWAQKHPIPAHASLKTLIKLLNGAIMGNVSTSDLAETKYLLHYAQMPANAVHFLHMQGQVDELTALEHNQINAAIFSPPQSFEAQAKGYARILFDTRDIPSWSALPYDVVMTTPAYAKAHPQITKEVLAAIEKGVADLASRSPAVLQFEEKANPGVSAAVVKQTLDFIEMTPYQPMTAEQWKGLNNFLVFGGLLKHPYPMKEGVDWTNQYLSPAP